MSTSPYRRLVIVVRADPVICGHSGEARNLAEAALSHGFSDVRIVTWPIERLLESGLPLKPLDSVLPYSPGITVERPEPIGDYKVIDGRYQAGVTARLVELFTDGIPTICMSLFLSPHTLAVADAVAAARATGLPVRVRTIAEAVGSDVTNVVRSAVEHGQFGAAAHVLTSYLSSDRCVAVSEYTRDVIVSAAARLDTLRGTAFAERCARRIAISYPAIDSRLFTELDSDETDAALEARGLARDGYVLFLSRLGRAKGVRELIDGFAGSGAANRHRLVIAGNGPEAADLHAYADASEASDRIVFLHDVGDSFKPHLMAGSAAFVLPSKPTPEFTETFGIALVEKMLAGGGPVITTDTGGIGEAVGDCALRIGVESPEDISRALDRALTMSPAERVEWEERARAHGLRFDRAAVFERLFAGLEQDEPDQVR